MPFAKTEYIFHAYVQGVWPIKDAVNYRVPQPCFAVAVATTSCSPVHVCRQKFCIMLGVLVVCFQVACCGLKIHFSNGYSQHCNSVFKKIHYYTFVIQSFYSECNKTAGQLLVAGKGKRILQLLNFPLLYVGTPFTQTCEVCNF